MEEAGDEEKGLGAPGLGTSSKVLEPGVKGTWGRGMVEAISPPLLLRRSGFKSSWRQIDNALYLMGKKVNYP
jgi:hypothetical protein